MKSVIRALVMYIFLMIIMRIAGRRTLAQMTNFDFILMLIISEVTQQALTGEDFSVTNSFLVIMTLVGIDIAFSLFKMRSKKLAKFMDGLPTVLVKDGKPFKERLEKARVDEGDILASARINAGVGTMDDIKYAILETDGGISIIPKDS